MSERVVAIGLFREAVQRLGEGQTATAARLADRARELFLTAADLDGACAAALLRGRTALRVGRLTEAADWLGWAREEALRRGLEPRVLAATAELAILAEMQGNLPTAVAAHRGVLERQRARDDNLGIAMAAGNVARLLPMIAPNSDAGIHEARALLAEALERFQEGPHEAGIANTMICLGNMERVSGDLAAARSLFEQVALLAPSPAVQPMRALAQQNLGHVLRDVGDYRPAVAAYRQAQALADALGDGHLARQATLSRAMTEAHMLPLAAPLAAVEALAQALPAVGDTAEPALVQLNLARLLGLGGSYRKALALARAAELQLRRGRDPSRVEEAIAVRALVALHAGDARVAHKWLRQRRAPATPALGRQRWLLRAAVALRELDLVGFDAAQAALGPDGTWAELAANAALLVQRAALAGVDGSADAQPLIDAAERRAAVLELTHLRLGLATAKLWLGEDAVAAALAAVAEQTAAGLGWVDLAAHSRAVQALCSAALPEAVRLGRNGAAQERGTAWSAAMCLDAAAAIRAGDSAALLAAVTGLRESGDSFRGLLFLASHGARQSPPTARRVLATVEGCGVFVPPWLRRAGGRA